ncbi:uncharacterized protein [Gossypium hirsutum]|uniref:Uncharacterized protein isoform X1 n=1 Tax=Gossypium hirsutum TaxID=3635 RepID=A0ABM2YLD2_GOSHI|nr:uncharacterized protein LOC107922874 isoform X1 [Gossypium hirsutum]
MLVWHHDATGEYSVKSRYWALVTRKFQLSEYNSNTTNNYKKFYKLLWDILPSKIKIHMWRLIKDYVPHFNNLIKRSLRVVNVCPLRKEAPEDPDHLLWFCGALRQLWQSLNLSIDLSRNTSHYKNRLALQMLLLQKLRLVNERSSSRLIWVSGWLF